MKNCEIIVCGERGSGKTSFLVALFACSQIQMPSGLNARLKTFTLKAKERSTKDKLSKLLKHVQTTGQYPPATDQLSEFKLVFKSSSKLLGLIYDTTEISWWDTMGETHHIDSPHFNQLLEQARGYAVFIDSVKLVNCSSLAERDKLLCPILIISEKIEFSKQSKPLAIIVTKTDLTQNIEVKKNGYFVGGREILHEHLSSLVRILKARNIRYKIEYSATTIEKDGNLFTIKNIKTLAFLSWLTDTNLRAEPASLSDWSYLFKQTYAPLAAIILALLGTCGLWAWSLNSSPSREPANIDVLERG
jgi:AAA15 family ATPase/GTPase